MYIYNIYVCVCEHKSYNSRRRKAMHGGGDISTTESFQLLEREQI